MKIKIKMKNRSHRYNINRPKPRDMDTNVVNIRTVSLWWCLYVLSNTEAELKKALLTKKASNYKETKLR